jgi:hypothetical protein
MKLKIVVVSLFLLTLPCISFASSIMEIATDAETKSQTGYYFLMEQGRQDTYRYHNRLPVHGGLHEGPRQHCEPAPTPIPAAGWLFGTGIVGLYGVKRRMIK